MSDQWIGNECGTDIYIYEFVFIDRKERSEYVFSRGIGQMSGKVLIFIVWRRKSFIFLCGQHGKFKICIKSYKKLGKEQHRQVAKMKQVSRV
jgi:hypothetical protein